MKLLQAIRRQWALRRIRAHAATLGFDLSGLTDKQIEAGIKTLSHSAIGLGVSAAKVARAMTLLGKAWDDHYGR